LHVPLKTLQLAQPRVTFVQATHEVPLKKAEELQALQFLPETGP